MSISFSKEAAKAVARVMENAGLDTRLWAIRIQADAEENLQMAFVSALEYRATNHHGLLVATDSSVPAGVIVNYGTHNGRHGLVFLRRDDVRTNGKSS